MPPSSASFTISPQNLRKLFAAWSVPLPKARLILFGFRGCLPVTAPQGWAASVEARLAPVDHMHMRCTLGIWDVVGGKVFATPGSTVPHAKNVATAATQGGKGTNQLEPGFYADLTKGEHLQGKPRGHQALRQTAARFYRRAPKGLPYTEASPLFFGNPYDNLHCGWQLDLEAPDFSSAGCMVVAGEPHLPRDPASGANRGPWRVFHSLVYGSAQKSFPILLLGAGEAAEALAGKTRKRARLVFGSKGEAVKALQRRLAARKLYLGRADGDLGPRTYRAWNKARFA